MQVQPQHIAIEYLNMTYNKKNVGRIGPVATRLQ